MTQPDEIPIPRFQPSEAFSTDELQRSLGQPPKPKIPTPEFKMSTKKEPPIPAKTRRAERIANVLSGRPAQPPGNVPQQELLNHQARAALGELVSYFMEHGLYSELEVILKEHIEFSKNILNLLEERKG